MYFVYGLYNKKHNKIYIGQSEDLDIRVVLHNDKIFKRSYASRFDGEWIVIYKEEAADRKAALIREKQLKSYRGREYIKQYIPR